MKRAHRDENLRISGERHAGIVIKDKQLLLIHRIREGYEYYVFPGGHRRNGEQRNDTVIHEVYEETGITVNHPRLTGEEMAADSMDLNLLPKFAKDWLLEYLSWSPLEVSSLKCCSKFQFSLSSAPISQLCL